MYDTITDHYRVRVVNYFDVWGNKKEGYEVNDLCEYSVRIVHIDQLDYFQHLKDVSFLRDNVRRKQVVIDDSTYPMIEVYHKKSQAPLCRLELDRVTSYNYDYA